MPTFYRFLVTILVIHIFYWSVITTIFSNPKKEHETTNSTERTLTKISYTWGTKIVDDEYMMIVKAMKSYDAPNDQGSYVDLLNQIWKFTNQEQSLILELKKDWLLQRQSSQSRLLSFI